MNGILLSAEGCKRSDNTYRQLTHAAAAVCRADGQERKAPPRKQQQSSMGCSLPLRSFSATQRGVKKAGRRDSQGAGGVMSTAPREGVLGFRCRNAGKPEGRKLPSFPWTPLIQTVSLEVGPTCLHLQMQTTRVRGVSGWAQGHTAGQIQPE